MMMVVMMMGRGVCGNYRTSQNHECDGSKEQRAQFHKGLSVSHSWRVNL
jgi:hypothetical protein